MARTESWMEARTKHTGAHLYDDFFEVPRIARAVHSLA